MRFLSLSAVFLLAASAPAAPGPTDKPVHWEYAEMAYRFISPPDGGPGANGGLVPRTPDAWKIRWITEVEELEMKSWTEVAVKFKVPGFKKAGSVAAQKIQLLNFLGGEGWELIEQRGAVPVGPGEGGLGGRGDGTSMMNTWLFKRRAP